MLFHYLCKQGYSAAFWWNCTNVRMEPAYMQSARCQVKITDTNPAPSKHWHPPPSVGCVALTVDGSFSAANPLTKWLVYKKRGAFLYPYTCARTVGAAPTVTPSRTGEVSQGKTEAHDNKSNAKAKTTKSRGTKQVPPARPLPGQPQQPPQDSCRGSSPHTNKASHPGAHGPQRHHPRGARAREGPSVVACRSL